MGSKKIFSLQRHIGGYLLDKIESNELTVDRVQEISQKVLEIIPSNASDDMFGEVLHKLSSITELRGLEDEL